MKDAGAGGVLAVCSFPLPAGPSNPLVAPPNSLLLSPAAAAAEEEAAAAAEAVVAAAQVSTGAWK